ncbi:fibulin-1-like [Stigmatopora nigra]
MWTLLLLLCGFSRGYAMLGSTHPHTIHGCCLDGKENAQSIFNCTDLPYISHSHTCRLAQEQCCTAHMEDLLCNYGTTTAYMQGACERYFFPGQPWENRIAKRCCDCCMLGMASAEQERTCDMSNVELGKVCEHVAKTCCAQNYTTAENSSGEMNVTRIFTVTGTLVPPLDSNVTLILPVAAYNCSVRNCSQLCFEGGICGCFVGYRQGSDGITCEDVDECMLGAHNCVAGQTCINTEGSFHCQRQITCGAGYQQTDSNQCRDIDECALNLHNCEPTFTCINSEGSFRCYPKEICSQGFIPDAFANCIDVDECVGNSGLCQHGQTCTNTIGSYTCRRDTLTCGRGYHLNAEGTLCKDIDECQVQKPCRGHACINMLGTYRCKCNNGFLFNSITKLCEDINECIHYPQTLCVHQCVNIEGSYLCSCSSGFLLSEDGKNCEDVDECEAKPCSQECTNVYGSYKCSCHYGYKLSSLDGVTCEDIDECALPTGVQICPYRCSNVPGSFYCTCPPEGYAMASDGRSCKDIDECASGNYSCEESELCFNILGGYRCLDLECPPFYRKAAQGSVDKNSVQMRCHKACHPNNVACLRDTIQIVNYIVVSQPNYRHLGQPQEIVKLQTAMPAQPFNSNIDVNFEILKTDDSGSFQVIKSHYHGYVVGVVNQVMPLVGPRAIELQVLLNYVRSGSVSHRNIAVIYIVISEFWF